MLRKRRERLNAGGMQQEVSETVVTAKDAKEMMFDKWTKNERSASAHKDLMEVARPLRKHEAKKLPALQLLRAYPALGVNDIVSGYVISFLYSFCLFA